MFNVKFLDQNLPGKKSILNGVGFGFYNKDIFFEVKSDKIETPLIIKFKVIKDDNKKSELIVGDIENNTLELCYYNPPTGTCGLSNPIGYRVLNEYILGFMFFLDVLADSNCYRITYDFYEGCLGGK